MNNRVTLVEGLHNQGEFLLDFGRCLEYSRRTGHPVLIDRRLGDIQSLVVLAARFNAAPEVVKFRAIAEQWSLDQISEVLN